MTEIALRSRARGSESMATEPLPQGAAPGEWSEIRVPGFFTIIEPLMRLLAKRAWHKGIDGELEAGYCS